MTGKKWLEQPKGQKPPKAPITEKFLQPPKNPDSDIVKDKPIITTKKPTNQDNSLLPAKAEKKLAITNYQPKPLISEILPRVSEKFFLNASKQLPVITNREQPINKEQILLTRIKQLEEQLAKVQVENAHLKLENKHLKALIRKDQETETKILQPLPLKIKN